MSAPQSLRIEVIGLPAVLAFIRRVAEVAEETDDFSARNALDDALETLASAMTRTDAGGQP